MKKCLVTILVNLSLLYGTAFSVTTLLWEVRDFETCKLENVMLDKDGFAMLAPKLECVWENSEVYVWALLEADNTLYVGTGAEGKVYTIKGKKVDLLFDTGEAGVFSLAEYKDKLYVGTAPYGIIYVVDKKGEDKIFQETGEEYIWELVFDNKGNLYAATGIEGKILKIKPNGEVDTFYTTDKINVVSLTRSGSYFYAGTGEGGLVFKIDKKGKGSCIYDAAEEEITSIILRQDTVYLAAATDTGSSVYRILPDNKVEKVWETEATVRGMQGFGDKLLVAANNRIYEINGTGDEELLFELPANISCFYRNWMGTSEVGKVYKIDKILAKEGSIESPAHDTKGISEWGRLTFKGESEIKFMTRTGNTGKPDKTWYPWKEIANGGQIVSPASRFIQWQAILKHPAAKLKEVRIAYLPQNEKPVILSLNISGPSPEVNNSGDARISENARQIAWSYQDANGDSLSFNLYFRLREEKGWTLLKEFLADSFYFIDPKAFPDGEYELKLKASDFPSNPKGYALTDEKISEPYMIDNKPPAIELGALKDKTLAFRVKDALGYIKSCEYALDGGEWKLTFPVDKIFDSKTEEFKINLENARKVVVRAYDAYGNVVLESKKLK